MPVRPQNLEGHPAEDEQGAGLDAWLRPFDQDLEERRAEEEPMEDPGSAAGRRRVQQEDKEEENTEEGRRPATLQAPLRVSKQEREEHELTHMPYRSWCPICVQA